jgi:hypothetical protein
MSEQVSAFLNRPAPSTLFHYTNQAGMLGMVEIRTIWLSHTQYLNDDAAFLHATKIAAEVLDAMSKATLGAHPFRDVALSESKAERANVCVASFSEAADSLSQMERTENSRERSLSVSPAKGYLRRVGA